MRVCELAPGSLPGSLVPTSLLLVQVLRCQYELLQEHGDRDIHEHDRRDKGEGKVIERRPCALDNTGARDALGP